ncbi:hypothetical protein CBS101457_003445 [Exobasidium rhododendri]|nr:hypothetical protein CBS101457_003445 [Exobasidium rhododendri]
MYSLEVVAYDISLAYAYRKELPFSTYGENASLTVQNMIITLLIIWYSPKGSRQGGLLTSAGSSVRLPFSTSHSLRPVLLAGTAMVISSIFLFFLCPPPLLAVLQALSIPISLVSKLPQIVELHRNKEPGQLSAVVVFAQLLGTIARVYTTVVETGDWLLGTGFGLASVLNAVIAVQYVYYWNGKGDTTLSLPTSQIQYAKHSRLVSEDHSKERLRHAKINLSIDASGNAQSYPIGVKSSRIVSEKKGRVE